MLRELPAGAWRAAFRCALGEYKRDNLPDLAAALTYYGVLAIFPMLIALVAVLGMIGPSATQPLIDNLNAVAPGPAEQIFASSLRNIEHSRGAAGVLFVVGLGGALWSASAYVAAFMRASNVVWEVSEGRPLVRTLEVRLGVTLATLLLLTLSALAVVLTGGLARDVGGLVGVGSDAVTIWDLAKWPVLVLLVWTMLALLYFAAPDVHHPGPRWVAPGSVLAVGLWMLASAAFALYVANFASYNKTYGALGAVVVFLVWLWITNTVILLGAEFNAELERAREAAGSTATRKLRLEASTDRG